MQLGASKVLDPADLWDLERSDQASVIHDRYAEQLQKTASFKYPHVRYRPCLATCKPVSAAPRNSAMCSFGCTPMNHCHASKCFRNCKCRLRRPALVQGSVWIALLRAFGPKWALAGLLKLVHDVVNLSSPYILRQLLKHIKHTNENKLRGLSWAVLLFACGVTTVLLVNQYFLRVFRTCLHVKAALIQALYAKSLRVSMPAKNELGGGAIANLQSNDANKLWTLANYGHVLWSGPFQVRSCRRVQALHIMYAQETPVFSSHTEICPQIEAQADFQCMPKVQLSGVVQIATVWRGGLCALCDVQVLLIIFLLHRIIGPWPALAGLAVTVLLVPINTVIGKVVHKYRKELIDKTDARIKLVSEVINGVSDHCFILHAWSAVRASCPLFKLCMFVVCVEIPRCELV
jgi:ABC transporter transmembrane region